ncbi:MAG TPA: glycosyltransferase family 4 protein [Candidatus Nanoarchaeia archaeon]|nr:glycosyltransferase family 4 protein [Candidatus Nanoarchaeia archaeon]
MRILFVLENYLPHMGGLEVVFKNLCEGLVRKGHEVTVLTHRLRGTQKREVLNGVKVERIRSFYSRILFTFCAVWMAWRLAKNVDIIHTTAFNGAPPGWLAARLRKKPVLIHVHEVWIGMWSQVTSMSWLSAKVHDFLERAIYVLPFDKYICVSESTKKRLLSRDISSSKAVTIYNGYEEGFFDPSKWDGESVRKKIGAKGQFMLFSWGRPGVSKGHEFAILAMKDLRDKLPQSHLYLMLSDKDTYKKRFEYLQGLIAKEGLSDKVTLLESVPYKELGNYLKAADCIIVPSLSEGFGYVVLEACEMGKPVVATDNTSIPEVIWGNYVLVPPRDAKSIADGVLKAFKGKCVSSKKKVFSWKDNISRHEGIYKELTTR